MPFSGHGLYIEVVGQCQVQRYVQDIENVFLDRIKIAFLCEDLDYRVEDNDEEHSC